MYKKSKKLLFYLSFFMKDSFIYINNETFNQLENYNNQYNIIVDYSFFLSAFMCLIVSFCFFLCLIGFFKFIIHYSANGSTYYNQQFDNEIIPII
jgi:hypothetical protein